MHSTSGVFVASYGSPSPHVTNLEVRRRSAQPPATQTIKARRLRLFEHVARSDLMEDHTCALSACISNPPRDWRRPHGRPRQTWLSTIEKDLQEPKNRIWDWTAWFYTQDRVWWRKVVETATLQ